MRWWLVMVLQLTIVSAEGASTPVAPTTSVFATTNTPNPTPTPQTSSSVPVDSTSSPTSTPQMCPSLEPPLNGSVSTFIATSAPVDATSTYMCNEGYELAGSETVTCQPDGNWSGGTPECKVVDCGDPPNVTSGGSVVATLTTYNEAAKYMCEVGHRLTGSETITCQSNGTWSGGAPECKVVDCGAPPNVTSGGSVDATSTTYNKTAKYMCEVGHRLTGSETITCQSNGTWSGGAPECKVVDCGAPPNVTSGGSVDATSTTYNKTAKYMCEVGHRLTGSETITCQSNGNWSDGAPECELQSCPDVIDVTGRVASSTNVMFDSTIKFMCNDSYVLYPEESRVVQCIESKDGSVKWNASFPECGVVPSVALSNSVYQDFPTLTSPPINGGNSAENIVIDCAVQKGEPLPSLQWIYNTTVTVSNDSSDAVFQRNDGNSVQQLVFTMFNEQHEGNYSCEATNVVGKDTKSFRILLEVAPGRPSKPVEMSTGVKNVTIEWKAPEFNGNNEIISYDIQYRLNDSESWILSQNTSSLVATVKSLDSFKVYVFRVRAQNGIGPGKYSELSDPILTGQSKPGPLNNVTATASGPNSILVTWTIPSPETVAGVLNQFYIYYDSVRAHVDETLSSYNITNLTAHTNYSIQVAAETGAGIGVRSPEQAIRVTTEQDRPSEPPNIALIIPAARNLTVHWDDVPTSSQNGDITFIEICYNSSTFEAMTKCVNASGGSNSEVIDGLEEFVVYDIRIRAYTIVGPSDFSASERNRTLAAPSGPPTITSVMDTSSTSLFVRWNPPLPEDLNGVLIRYEVQLRENGSANSNYTSVDPGPGADTSLNISDLERWTYYAIQVRVISHGRDKDREIGGEWSHIMVVRTDEAIPDPPAFVKVIGNTSTTITLQWSSPQSSLGNIQRYIIEYNGTFDDSITIIIVRGQQFSEVATGLHPFSEYDFKVYAETTKGRSTARNISAKTLEDAPSAAPGNFIVTPVGYSDPAVLELSWQPVDGEHLNGILKHYLVRYIDLSSGNMRTDTASITMFKLNGLKPFTNYSLQVLAVTVEEGIPTNYTRQLTNEAPPSAPPGNFDVVPVGNSTPAVLQLNWEPVNSQSINGILKRYKVFYQEDSTSVTETVNVSLTETVFNLSSLKAYTRYSVWMVAVTVDDGEATPKLMRQTNEAAPSGPPKDFRVEAIGNSEPAILSVHWARPNDVDINGKLRGYKVKYREMAPVDLRRRDDGYQEMSVSSSNLSVNLSQLKPYTSYRVRVLAFTVSDGPPTQPKTIRTNAALPPDINIPQVTPQDIGVGTITFRIDNSSLSNFGSNGPIMKYQILAAVFPEGESVVKSDSLEVNLYIPPGEDMKGGPFAYVIATYPGEQGLPELIVAGEDKSSFTNQEVFNGPLRTDVAYNFFISASTQGEEGPLVRRSDYILKEPVKSKGESSNAATVIAVVVVIIVVLVIVLIIVMVMVYRRKQKGGFELVQGGGSMPLETIIENVGAAEDIFKPPSKINVSHLLSTVNRLHADGDFLFSDEYEHVEHPDKVTFTTFAADAPENRTKNRYTNINSYDHSRVHLSASSSGDYINANHVDAYGKEKAFIATQGPVPDSICDFWQMLWEQNSYVIVMLTKLEESGRLKCHQYWPESETQYYDDICVTPLKAVTDLPDYTVRKFSVKAPGTKDERIISLWHYLMWPDHGVPQHPYSLLNFIRKSSNANPPDSGPIIVHCSAGVGRTGTYIALFSLWKMMVNEGKVDVFGTVRDLRYQRCMMVQTESQYVFVYEALLDLIHCGDTEIAPQDLTQRIQALDREEQDSRETALEAEFKRLNGPRSPRYKCTAANLAYNQSKNRFVTVVPYDETRVKLAVVPGNEGSDYINASWLNSYWHRNAYIATQAPLSNTVNDFWRMISENNASTIVMLTNLSESGREMCTQYWPSKKQEYGNLVIEKTSEEPYEEYIQRDFMITDEDGQSVPVRQFQYTAWPQRGAPHIGIGMTDMIGQVERWKQQAGDGPVIVHCSAGTGRTGCFIALSILLDQLKTEGIIDVFQTIRGLRLRRSAMVQTLDQYRYCYSTILDFLASYDTYSNFK